MEELSEALKAVKSELRLARKVYRGTVFLYWAWVFPGIYLFSLLIERYCEISGEEVALTLSLIAAIGFIIEERRAFKRVIQLEEVLGKSERTSRAYLPAQILVWPISGVIASLYTENTDLWMLDFIGLGLLLLASVESLFTDSGDWRTFLAGMIILCSTAFYTGTAYAVMVISFAFALSAYLHIKGGLRE